MNPTVQSTLGNVFGTMCTILWTVQLMPQAFHNWKRKSSEGVSVWMPLLWFLTSIIQAPFFLSQDLPIPLIIQPHGFCILSMVCTLQYFYYGPSLRHWIMQPMIKLLAQCSKHSEGDDKVEDKESIPIVVKGVWGSRVAGKVEKGVLDTSQRLVVLDRCDTCIADLDQANSIMANQQSLNISTVKSMSIEVALTSKPPPTAATQLMAVRISHRRQITQPSAVAASTSSPPPSDSSHSHHRTVHDNPSGYDSSVDGGFPMQGCPLPHSEGIASCDAVRHDVRECAHGAAICILDVPTAISQSLSQSTVEPAQHRFASNTNINAPPPDNPNRGQSTCEPVKHQDDLRCINSDQSLVVRVGPPLQVADIGSDEPVSSALEERTPISRKERMSRKWADLVILTCVMGGLWVVAEYCVYKALSDKHSRGHDILEVFVGAVTPTVDGLAFIPQIVECYMFKSARGISLLYLVLDFAGGASGVLSLVFVEGPFNVPVAMTFLATIAGVICLAAQYLWYDVLMPGVKLPCGAPPDGSSTDQLQDAAAV